MASENKTKSLALVAAEEEEQLARNVVVWLNTYPKKPVTLINYEYLPDDVPAMALSAIQGASVTRRFIGGGHEAEYQFKVIYRIKPGNSIDKRLQADEMLDRLGDWAQRNPPDLGEGLRVREVRATARSTLFAVYENGDEDHQILMRLRYEAL